MSHFATSLHLKPAAASFEAQLAKLDDAMRELGFRRAKATEVSDREAVVLRSPGGWLTVCDATAELRGESFNEELAVQLSRAFAAPVVSMHQNDTVATTVRLAHGGRLVDAFCDRHHLFEMPAEQRELLSGRPDRWSEAFGSPALGKRLSALFVPGTPSLSWDVADALGLEPRVSGFGFSNLFPGGNVRGTVTARTRAFAQDIKHTARGLRQRALRSWRFVRDPFQPLFGKGAVDLRWNPKVDDVEVAPDEICVVAARALNRGGAGGPVTLTLIGSALDSGLVTLSSFSRVQRDFKAAPVSRTLRIPSVGVGFVNDAKSWAIDGQRSERLQDERTLLVHIGLRGVREGRGRVGIRIEARGQAKPRVEWFRIVVAASAPEPEPEPGWDQEQSQLSFAAYQLFREHRLEEAREAAIAFRARFPDHPVNQMFDELLANAGQPPIN